MKTIATFLMLAAGTVLAAENPYADYGKAMASAKGDPMAAEWQDMNKTALAKATAPDALAAFVRDEACARALLAEVKPAYATCPMKAAQIAAVSQYVMRKGAPEAERTAWVKALLSRARTGDDAYITMFCLDQLRWCGCAKTACAVRKIGEESRWPCVRGFAPMVARELAR